MTKEPKKADVPNRDECLRTLREAGCSEEVILHCEAVCGMATKIAKRCRARTSLVEAGALLHDIGRSKTHSISHAVEGGRIAQYLGMSQEIISIIENHIGAGIPKAEAESLGLPSRDFVPKTLEEKIVAHADNLIEGTHRISSGDAVADMVRRGLHESGKRLFAMHKELSGAAGIDIDDIR